MLEEVVNDVTILQCLLRYISKADEDALIATFPSCHDVVRCYRTVNFAGVPCLCQSFTDARLTTACAMPGRFLLTAGRGQGWYDDVMLPALPPLYDHYNRRWRVYMKYSQSKGWGVFAGCTLAKGSRLFMYTGELLSSEDTRKRQRETYDPQGINYVLTIREHTATSILRTNIDATYVGSVARFVNHSCDPNLHVTMVREHPRQMVGIPVLVAARTVAPGEELTFCYGEGDLQQQAQAGGAETRRSKRACHCGVDCCRGWLPCCEE